MGLFNCLYYPFSRLEDPNSLKYLLLTFDSITFLDEKNIDFRQELLKKMSANNPYFSSFNKLIDDYELLLENKIVRVVNPLLLRANNSSAVVYSILADLSDSVFVAIGSHPEKYGLPTNINKATWDIFQGKIPKPLILDDRFRDLNVWKNHTHNKRDEKDNWTLSYPAGSSVAINLYLEAADELDLTPITTSKLHHDLLMQKVSRTFFEENTPPEFLEPTRSKRFKAILGAGEMMQLVNILFPPKYFKDITVKEILKFREETQELRIRFQNEIDYSLEIIDSDPNSPNYYIEVKKTLRALGERFIKMNNAIANARDKIFPAFTKALALGGAGGGALGALVSFLGGYSTAGVVAASALTIGGTFLTETLKCWNEIKKIKRKQKSSVAYLAAIANYSKYKIKHY